MMKLYYKLKHFIKQSSKNLLNFVLYFVQGEAITFYKDYTNIILNGIFSIIILFGALGFFNINDDAILGIAFFILLFYVISFSKEIITQSLTERKNKIIHDIFYNFQLIENNLYKRELWYFIQDHVMKRFYFFQNFHFYEHRLKRLNIKQIRYKLSV